MQHYNLSKIFSMVPTRAENRKASPRQSAARG
jgi:hypothetical protein